MNTPDGKPLFGGLNVMTSDALPPNTILVSRDVHALLTETPAERQEKARALRDKCDQLSGMIETLLRKPLP